MFSGFLHCGCKLSGSPSGPWIKDMSVDRGNVDCSYNKEKRWLWWGRRRVSGWGKQKINKKPLKEPQRASRGSWFDLNNDWTGRHTSMEVSVGGVTMVPRSPKHTKCSHFVTRWTIAEAVSLNQKTWKEGSREQDCEEKRKRIKIYSCSLPGGPKHGSHPSSCGEQISYPSLVLPAGEAET